MPRQFFTQAAVSAACLYGLGTVSVAVSQTILPNGDVPSGTWPWIVAGLVSALCGLSVAYNKILLENNRLLREERTAIQARLDALHTERHDEALAMLQRANEIEAAITREMAALREVLERIEHRLSEGRGGAAVQQRRTRRTPPVG